MTIIFTINHPKAKILKIDVQSPSNFSFQSWNKIRFHFFQMGHVTAWMMVSHIFIFSFIIANNLCNWNKKSWNDRGRAQNKPAAWKNLFQHLAVMLKWRKRWLPDTSKPIHIGKTSGERSMWGFLLWILTIVSITHNAVYKSTRTFVLNGGSSMIHSLLIKLWKEKL